MRLNLLRLLTKPMLLSRSLEVNLFDQTTSVTSKRFVQITVEVKGCEQAPLTFINETCHLDVENAF